MRKLIIIAAIAAAGLSVAACSRDDRTDIKEGAAATGAEIKDAAGDIADAFELSKPTMSHHLRVLKGAGLVRAERQGTSIVYTLQSNVVEDAVAELMGMMATPIKKRART